MNWVHDFDGEGQYADSDIDIIIVASSEAEALVRATKTLHQVKRAVGPCAVIQTPNSISVIPNFPHRHVQIMTLFNKSLPEYSGVKTFGHVCF